MTIGNEFLIPFSMSVVALFIWILVFGGVVDLWRSRRPVPSGVVAAFMLVIAGCVITRMIGTLAYTAPPADTNLVAVASHVQRALLVLTGSYALWTLVRSRRIWRANGTRRPR